VSRARSPKESDDDAHLDAPHLGECAARLDDLLDERGLVIERLRRIA
jgi:hypothetical protein